MPRNSERLSIKPDSEKLGARLWLRVAVIGLAGLNAIALFFYLDPPGGSRQDLAQQSLAVRNQVIFEQGRTARLSNVAAKVTVGNAQSGDFEMRYFLPKRMAYATVIAEIQRMAKAAGLQERDAVYTEEPIEGTSDLDLLNCTANYEGNYDALLKFLNEVDHSPMLLMMENLQAAPQQKAGQINTSIRFQAVIQEEPIAAQSGGILQ